MKIGLSPPLAIQAAGTLFEEVLPQRFRPAAGRISGAKVHSWILSALFQEKITAKKAAYSRHFESNYARDTQ